jgi:crotonobetainyl-CoA:carnitine CoA-transferase CaiB-like acyl-CoA transferase
MAIRLLPRKFILRKYVSIILTRYRGSDNHPQSFRGLTGAKRNAYESWIARHLSMSDGNDVSSMPRSDGALKGIRVLDLSRILAGPWASQILGDLGAQVLKVEHPSEGDDTRHWGPPFLDSPAGSKDSAYFSCCNRNKEALAIDFSHPEGAALVRRLACSSHIIIENFRVGHLEKYGLDYAALRAEKPDLIYCSITGFGQTGPYASRGGYDFLIQGMSGLMSVTGHPDEGRGSEPLKVGIPVSDLFTGLYAAISILAALNHRDRTGEGQYIDCALLDSQLAVMSNQAANYLVGGAKPKPLGNEHPSVVPYRDFKVADGRLLIAITNDRQFRNFCALLGCEELTGDERFLTNAGRSANRRALEDVLAPLIAKWRSADLLEAMEKAKLPCGPINTVDEALTDPHVRSRGLMHTMHRDDGGTVPVIGYPHQFSCSPATLRKAPPRLGQDTRKVLRELLMLDTAELDRLEAKGAIMDASLDRKVDSRRRSSAK